MDIERDLLYLLDQELKRYKKKKDCIDYNDMLENLLNKIYHRLSTYYLLTKHRTSHLCNGEWLERYGKSRQDLHCW